MTIGQREIAITRRNFYNDVMRIYPAKSILALWLTIIFLNACAVNKTENSNAAAPNSNQTTVSKGEIVVQDDVENLAKLIKLPFTPEEATFTETDSKDKKLVAVLKFTPANANAIIANAEKHKSPVAADIDAEMWFPPELIAKSQESGDEVLKGNEYAANDFFQSSYSNGKLTRINDTNYFVLELNTL